MKLQINGKETEVVEGKSAGEIAKDLNLDKALAVKIDGQTVDLTTTVTTTTKTLEFIDFESKEGKEIFRHSASHILAAAVKQLFPDVKFAIGPAVEDGFYYDFDSKEPFTPADLKKIQKEMHRIMKKKLPFERVDCTVNEAKEHQKDQPYKIEMIDDLGDEQMTVYKMGEFTDLCRGPHVPTTGYIKAFKLTKLAGAYWRGDVKNKQLQRIYGVAFSTKDELKEYMRLLEEAQKRDHRKLGKKLKLFSFHDEGPGFPFWHPKGLFLFNKLLEVWRKEHEKAGYVEVKTPIILSRKLWEQSGHWKNYAENMYFTKIDEEDYAIKPMNCPGGMLMYNETVHSYKELPLKIGEVGLVHRHELSGVLSGLFRVRQFHQDDAHIYMTPEQIVEEVEKVINLTDKFYKMFGLTFHMELSTKPDKAMGTDEQWDLTTNSLKEALEKSGREYVVNEGDGAFYGPKIDFHIKDAIGRTWQCGTIQLDMAQPDNFDLTYMGEDGENKHRPVMIHRTIYGSLERFIGILIEHYTGKFPLWLSPVQVKILAVADRFNDYAKQVKDELTQNGFRVELDSRSETLSKKVREAQLEKVNYILVVGEQEVTDKTVTVRTRNNEVKGAKSVADFLSDLKAEVKQD
jgi:threonyl-tRNA synthetase